MAEQNAKFGEVGLSKERQRAQIDTLRLEERRVAVEPNAAKAMSGGDSSAAFAEIEHRRACDVMP